ncbi:MAG: ribosome small subunit-dependent GTPase A [Verrucomicrobia bacterium]|nr:ribosome small subunit-dependent GTPase A [Verrucomicrobiota bacterium]
MDLASLGWSDFFAANFAGHREQGLLPARVVTEDKLHYTVVGETGDMIAVIAGKMLHHRGANAALPKVGDWVAIAPQPGENKAVIHAVLPRRTHLTRKETGRESTEQVLATNMDTAFVVQALDVTFNLRRMERFLVMVHDGGAQPVVVLNKADLCAEVDARVAEAHAAAGNTPVIVVSAKTRKGIGQLREFIKPGETVVFIGTSGVGKSSLINRLNGEATQPTLEVRASDSKGRHSTTWRELIPLPAGGLVIDTPGMREFHMGFADEGIDEAFPDLMALGAGCKFRDCSHQNEPGCAVKAAVESGTVPRARYESFLKLQRELAFIAEQRKEHTYTVNKRRSKLGTKAWLRNG